MTKETLEALDASIDHWKRMRKDRRCGERPVGTDCALCRLFNHFAVKPTRCRGCPVYESTGYTLCFGTPYVDADIMFHTGTDEEFYKAATAEIEFLESLRPI